MDEGDHHKIPKGRRRIRMKYDRFMKISKVTLGEKKADLVLKNARVVDVFTEEVHRADVAVCDGVIAGIGTFYEGNEEIDLEGKYLIPGLIDAHLHLESTMVTPNELVSLAAACGTTTFIVDPHEAANVSGTEGIDYILDQTEDSPANVYVMLPSCVPATEFDDNGCELTAEKMAPYLKNPRILGLGEVMNDPGVVYGDRKLHEKLELFEEKISDGHAPYLPSEELSAYALAGIRTDHECTSYEYAMEEVRRGIHVHIREGSAAHNLEAIVKGIVKHNTPTDCFSFCTDDKHIEDILRDGHIGYNVKKAIELGLSPFKAIKMATVNTARCYGLRHLGALAPGYQADMAVVGSLEEMDIKAVFFKGKRIDPEKKPEIKPCPRELGETVHLSELKEADFRLPIKGNKAHIIELDASQITTKHREKAIGDTDNYIPANGLNKIAAVERHRGTGKIGVGICSRYGIENGAVASSVSHDSHNIIVVGDNDRDMALAVNAVIASRGGYSLVENGEVYDTLPLPVMGLMSDAGYENVSGKLERMINKAHAMGIPDDVDPFITLSFLALPVIPEIRITPRGLLDTVRFKLIK